MKKIFLTFAFVLLSLSQYAYANKCEVNRYIFDIGSGATKLQAKKVDVCNNTIISDVAQEIIHINYQNCIDNSTVKSVLPESCMHDGVLAIKNLLKDIEVDCFVESCYAIATQWSRNITNFDTFVAEMNKMGIVTKSISQTDEGILAYRSLVYDIDVPFTNYAVWDIGAGSSQVAFAKDNDVVIFDYPRGLNAYSNYFHKEVVHKKAGTLNMEELKLAINTLKKEIINNENYYRLKNLKSNKIYSIGRIFNFALVKELGYSSIITKEKLYEDLEFFASHTLEEASQKFPNLPKKFAHHAQMTLVFVYAFLDAFEWEQVDVRNILLTDYLLLAGDEYWEDA